METSGLDGFNGVLIGVLFFRQKRRAFGVSGILVRL